MGLLEDKKTAAALIIRKMGSPSSDYDSMKRDNEEMKQVPSREGAELDSGIGRNAAVEEMMRAVELKSAAKFKMALDSYLQMWIDEQDIEREDD